MQQSVALVRRKTMDANDLSEAVRGPSLDQPAEVALDTPRSLKDIVNDVEKQCIVEALHANQNNQQRTAKALGISRQGLIKKMKRYMITTPRQARRL